MRHIRLRKVRRLAISTLLGTTALVVPTFVARPLHLEFGMASSLYLVIVVLQSLAGDFLAAAAVSTIAVACLDFFHRAVVHFLAGPRSGRAGSHVIPHNCLDNHEFGGQGTRCGQLR